MTPRHDTAPTPERIEDVDVVSEMQDSYLEYAYSVIYSRALPDARDGLKPVQRRILFQMSQMGLRPDRGHVKSARVTGEVMGKLHPHGDSAIYDALVRMAQDFTLRVPLIDGHGNFGSLDDGPAAARYTEVRLAPPALAMTENLDEDVVTFVPNYDDQLTQPSVLPSAFPNLLVNGASGIAVGMATNMPPHNLGEVIDAARHLIAHPEASVEELMRFVPGPDLPGGGIIVGREGIAEAYTSGRGIFKTRAKASIERVTARRTGIVITELPYLVGPEKVIEKIKQGVRSKKLQGISDVDDLSDGTNGLRLVVGVKAGFDPQAVLARLYQHTPLEDSFAINNVALVDGSPRTLGLKELLEVYIDHRIQVVTRRSDHRLQKHLDRLHLVEGLLIAVLDIDEVIQLIRDSDDADEARGRLMKVFDLSRVQSEYILELRLRRLTKFSRIELESERDELTASIERLRALLADDGLIRRQVSEELAAAAEEFATARRTVLLDERAEDASSGPTTALEVPDEACRVVLTASGKILRTDAALPADGGAGPGEGLISPASPARGRRARRIRHDAVASVVVTTTRARLGALTSAGRVLSCTPVELPAMPGAGLQFTAGVEASAYAAASAGERVVALVVAGEVPFAIGTAAGVVKRVTLREWPAKDAFPVISLKPGDRV
ncbi:MAG TPA: DNA topoisomerase IV subunit A, partial [Microbacteriaceae bacterium]|nr:DNA topoisomerase IV subunit A [Microbacteriaceae bacterium]